MSDPYVVFQVWLDPKTEELKWKYKYICILLLYFVSKNNGNIYDG